MKIGIIDAHVIGLRRASEFAGHDIAMTNSREPENVRQQRKAPGACDGIDAIGACIMPHLASEAGGS